MTLCRSWKLARNALLGLVAVVLIFAAVVTIINFYDEPASPEAGTLLARAPNTLRPEENIYVALLGFNAPNGTSTAAWGQSVISAYEAELGSSGVNARSESKSLPASEKAKFVGRVGFCKPMTSSCWEHWQDHEAETEKLVRDNQELYNRYLELHALAGYYETTSPSFEAPMAYVPSEVRNLFVANFVVRMHASVKNERKAAIRDICADIEMWRLVLIAEGTVLSKMVAIANLHGDLAAIADMLADPTIDASEFSGPEIEKAVLADARDWRMGNAFAAEFRAMDQFVKELEVEVRTGRGKWIDEEERRSWWALHVARISNHFLKFQATENLYASEMAQLQVFGNASPADFKLEQAQWHEWEATHFQMLSPRSLYNPSGKLMLSIGAGIYDEYPKRAQDLAAFERAVKLAYEIRINRITNGEVPAYIHSHSELALYPATGEEVTWDAMRSQISIRPMVTRSPPRRFTIPIWRTQQ